MPSPISFIWSVSSPNGVSAGMEIRVVVENGKEAGGYILPSKKPLSVVLSTPTFSFSVCGNYVFLVGR